MSTQDYLRLRGLGRKVYSLSTLGLWNKAYAKKIELKMDVRGKWVFYSEACGEFTLDRARNIVTPNTSKFLRSYQEIKNFLENVKELRVNGV